MTFSILEDASAYPITYKPPSSSTEHCKVLQESRGLGNAVRRFVARQAQGLFRLWHVGAEEDKENYVDGRGFGEGVMG